MDAKNLTHDGEMLWYVKCEKKS